MAILVAKLSSITITSQLVYPKRCLQIARSVCFSMFQYIYPHYSVRCTNWKYFSLNSKSGDLRLLF